MRDNDDKTRPTGFLDQPRRAPIRRESWIAFGVMLLLLAMLVADVVAYQHGRLAYALLAELIIGGLLCITIGIQRGARS